MEVSILNRSAGRLEYFQNEGFATSTWENFEPEPFEMVINTTSAGLSDSDLPLPSPLLEGILSRVRYAVDVIYGKETPFLREVKAHGLPHKDGSDMLLQQGVLANHLFLHCKCSPEDIEPAMKESFLY
jgi:shikimate dehydrogenase